MLLSCDFRFNILKHNCSSIMCLNQLSEQKLFFKKLFRNSSQNKKLFGSSSQNKNCSLKTVSNQSHNKNCSSKTVSKQFLLWELIPNSFWRTVPFSKNCFESVLTARTMFQKLSNQFLQKSVFHNKNCSPIIFLLLLTSPSNPNLPYSTSIWISVLDVETGRSPQIPFINRVLR